MFINNRDILNQIIAGIILSLYLCFLMVYPFALGYCAAGNILGINWFNVGILWFLNLYVIEYIKCLYKYMTSKI